MLVGVGNAPVVLFLERILRRILIRIPPLPEILDERFPLFVGGEVNEGATFFGGDNVNDVFVEPLLVSGIQLVIEVFVLLLALFPGFFGVLRGLLVLFFLLWGSCVGNCGAQQSPCKNGE